LLFKQNNEKITQLLIRSTVTGTAKIMSYDDIVEAQRKRDVKEALPTNARKGCRTRQKPATGGQTSSRVEELEHGRREIEAHGLEKYCSVLQF
jgi:hypothetical protein